MKHSSERVPAGEPEGAGREAVEVVLVGAGARARSWLEPLRGAARLRLVATVARSGESLVGAVPAYTGLETALREHPAAAFAVALPPRAGLDHALRLAAAGRAGVVEAPLHDALADAALGSGASLVRVAHGWVTLPGCRAIAAVLERAGGGELNVEVSGLPEEENADPGEALVHALALVRALLPGAAATAAHPVDGGSLQIALAAPAGAGAWRVRLRVRPRGGRVAVRVEAGGETVLWSVEDGLESVRVGDAPGGATRTPPTAAVRALAQLLGGAGRGDGLPEAAEVLRLTRHCQSLLPVRPPLGARVFRQAAAIAARRPDDLLGRLGLRGDLAATGEAVRGLAETAAPEPFELWAFRAGIKPVAFLTVRPEEVARTLAYFGDAASEQRERRVRVEAQDRWSDRRDEGEPRVELYIARDRALARRMAYLQAEVDPTQALRELGALAGYPACCVDAFARQDDRANNSRNRYCTQARTPLDEAPWPWELNNLHTMTVAFFPCSYRCAAALTWARAALAEMARVHPEAVRALRDSLARPVLYFDHEHQVVFAGTATAGVVVYRSVALPRPAAPAMAGLAAALACGNRLRFDDDALRVGRGDEDVLVLERTDPGLGFIAPFG